MKVEDLIAQLQPFIDEMQARAFAQEAILQSVIARLSASDGDWLALIAAIEQQSLHSLANRGPEYRQIAGNQVHQFFATLRKWKTVETTAAPDSGTAH